MFNLGPMELLILAAILLIGFVTVVAVGALVFFLVRQAMKRTSR